MVRDMRGRKDPVEHPEQIFQGRGKSRVEWRVTLSLGGDLVNAQDRGVPELLHASMLGRCGRI